MPDDRDIRQIVEPEHRPAEVVFAVVSFGFALFLASQAASQLTWDSSRAITHQPAFWPVMAIAGMLAFGVFELAAVWRRRRETARSGIAAEVFQWARATEYAGWFMAYVLAVPLAGYLPATLAFTFVLTWRLGYRSTTALLAALATGLATVIFFKSLLSVKIPGGALYDYLPAALRNFMILNF